MNEFLAKKGSTLADEFGEYDDWIEILNVVREPVALGGLGLSDDLSRPRLWASPDTTILPGESLLVWTDDDPEQGSLHATFKLGAGGEDLALWARDEDGNVLIDSVIFGEQEEEDLSMGRLPDGTGPWVFLDPPTPGAPNEPPAGLHHGSPANSPRSPVAPTIRIWPNPAAGRVEIVLLGPHGRATPGSGPRLGIYDALGGRVGRLALRADPPAACVDLANLLERRRPGIYWLRPLEGRHAAIPAGRLVLLDSARPR